ncbi:MAG: hypothetical protein AAF787_15440 [Chloroflexota bacterium]
MTSSKREDIKQKIQEILNGLGFIIGDTDDEIIERAARTLYGRVKNLEVDIDILEEELTQMYLRNGAFPGDMIGWLDDDFTVDEPEDDDSDET